MLHRDTSAALLHTACGVHGLGTARVKKAHAVGLVVHMCELARKGGGLHIVLEVERCVDVVGVVQCDVHLDHTGLVAQWRIANHELAVNSRGQCRWRARLTPAAAQKTLHG